MNDVVAFYGPFLPTPESDREGTSFSVSLFDYVSPVALEKNDEFIVVLYKLEGRPHIFVLSIPIHKNIGIDTVPHCLLEKSYVHVEILILKDYQLFCF